MEFFRRSAAPPERLAILAGAFNPPTSAHLALAASALSCADEALFVLPRAFPHKPYHGASFEDRVRMLLAATEHEHRFSVAASCGGLFAEIASECRPHYPAGVSFAFLCGADAAQRIVHWDYGEPSAFLHMLAAFELWVAARGVAFDIPPEMRGRIHTLPLDAESQQISASEVRRRIARGDAWESLVPEPVRELARQIYS
jgi:nicotinate-nucleotide adenylyltransferase